MPTAEGAQKLQALADGGFSSQELSQFQQQQTAALTSAGFKPSEIDQYWGSTNDHPADTLVEHGVKKNWDPADAKVANDPLSYLAAGWDMSVASLAQHAPKTVLPQHAGFMGTLLAGVGQTVGDIPTFTAGFLAGAPTGAKLGAAAGALVPGAGETGLTEVAGAAIGGTTTGVMGGTALSEGTRQSLMQGYLKGSIKDANDFFQRSAIVAYNTAKATAVAGASAAVGGVVGGKALALTGSSSTAAVSNALSFAATSTGVSAALDGKVPDADSFGAAAASVIGLHFAGEVVGAGQRYVLNKSGQQMAGGLRDVYGQTGVPPWEAAQRAKADPVVMQETVARDVNDEIKPNIFNADRSPEPPHFAGKPLEVDVTGIPGNSADLHLKAIETLEGSAAAAKLQTRLSGKIVTPDTVVSPAGAIGRYQIMPATARQYMGPNFDVSTLTDPKVNASVATKILTDLAQRYKLADGSPDNEAIYIAYNAGPGRANRFLAAGRDPSILPVETQKYIQRADAHGLINLKEGEFTPVPGKEVALTGGGGGGEPPGGKPPGGEGEEPLRLNGASPKDKTDDELNASVASLIDVPDRESLLSRARGLADTAYDDYVSELGPAKRLDEAMGLDKSDKVNFEDLFRSTYASPERAGYFVRTGVIDSPFTFKAGEPDSIIGAYKQARDEGGTEAGFTNYRLAKRSIDLESRGIKSGYDAGQLADAQELVSRKRVQYEAADMQANRAKAGVLRYAQKAGLYSEKQVDAMLEQNPSHIPFNRADESDVLPVRGAGRGMQSRQNLKKMSGSQRRIVEPVHAEIESIHGTIQNADRNVALQAIVGLDRRILDQLGIKKAEVQPEPETPLIAPKPGTELTAEQQKALAPGGAATPEGAAAARAKNIGNGEGPRGNEFTVYVDGKPVTYTTTDPGWARLINGSPKIAAEYFTKAMKFAANLERTGITILPDYLARMMIRLQVSTSVMEPFGGVPGMNFFSGIMTSIVKPEVFQEFVRSGGMGAGMIDMEAKYIRRDIERVFTQSGVIPAVTNVVFHPIEAARLLMERAEAMGRLGASTRAQNAGYSNLKAAMNSRRAYLDFKERQASAVVNWWTNNVPFMKLGILAKEQIVRQLTKDPLGFIGRGMIYVALPTIALYYLRSEIDKDKPDNEKWSNQPQWIQDHYWGVPNPNGPYIKIPKPYEVGMVFGTQIENFMRWHETNDPKAFKALGENLLEMIAPNVLPPALTPIAENSFNHNITTGRTLIPHSVDGASNYMQYTQNTSPTAVKIARLLGPPGINLLNVSPIVLQNYVKGWTGTGGQLILHALDTPQQPWKPQTLSDNPFVGSFFARTEGSMQPVEDFYDAYEELKKASTDFHLAIKHQDQDEIDFTSRNELAFVKIDGMAKALGNMQTAINGITIDKSMNVNEKRQQIDQITNSMVQLAQTGTKILDQVKAGQAPTRAQEAATGAEGPQPSAPINPAGLPGQAPAAPTPAAPVAAPGGASSAPATGAPARGPNGTLDLSGGGNGQP